MRTPWTPGEVDARLQDGHDRYETLLDELDDAGRRSAQAKAAYNRAHAEAMARAVLDSRNADEREAKVTLEVADAELAKFLAEHAHGLVKARIGALDEQVGILRTLSASHRSVS